MTIIPDNRSFAKPQVLARPEGAAQRAREGQKSKPDGVPDVIKKDTARLFRAALWGGPVAQLVASQLLW